MYRNSFLLFILPVFIVYLSFIQEGIGASVHETSFSYLTHNKLIGAPTTKAPIKFYHKNSNEHGWIMGGKLPIYTRKRVKLKPPKLPTIDFAIRYKGPRLRTNIFKKNTNSTTEKTVSESPIDPVDSDKGQTQKLKLRSQKHDKKETKTTDKNNHFQNKDSYSSTPSSISSTSSSSWSFPSLSLSLPSLKVWPFTSSKKPTKIREKDGDEEQINVDVNKEKVQRKFKRKKTQRKRIRTRNEYQYKDKGNTFFQGIAIKAIDYFF